MHKALHPRNDIDKHYVSEKKKEEDSPVYYIKMSKERLITSASKDIENIRKNRTTPKVR